ncbi:YceI family protein [Runella sp. MFBS21]|uniref:YceI family protein n=1 Tax=Runella sp. MFBS21 TaxID=3034018 RepID=UPI0023F8AEA0|nr:YceI family protein [Runella sp. MFBS21]MDF7821534.1 YceI family protein [Runella sp. MFBS21]
MKKEIALILLLSTSLSICIKAQNLYATNNGETSFFSETPVENISAINKLGQAIINITNNDIVVQMNIKQFDFPNKLMQEHFNENYMESSKYPKAVFKGKINEKIDFTKSGIYDVSATGDFTIHGVSKPRTFKGKLNITPDKLNLTTDFEVSLTDHNIEVPKVVFMKIAQVIKVKNNYTLTPYVAKK